MRSGGIHTLHITLKYLLLQLQRLECPLKSLCDHRILYHWCITDELIIRYTQKYCYVLLTRKEVLLKGWSNCLVDQKLIGHFHTYPVLHCEGHFWFSADDKQICGVQKTNIVEKTFMYLKKLYPCIWSLFLDQII